MDEPREPRRSGRIEVNVPTTYVQTDETVWEDLEKYLFNGFLTSHAIIYNQSFVFKTLNHLELKSIEMMRTSPIGSSEARSAFRSAFIAYSVLMANGSNVLWDRPRNIQRLVKTFSRIPGPQQDKIIESLSALNSKGVRVYPLTEIYAYENRSRFRWAQYKDVNLNSTAVTGLPGTEHIGMNQCQLTWIAMNRFLDKRDDMERDWANAKFVGSCMAGKGIRSVEEKDRLRLERERNEREDKKMEVLKSYLNRTVGAPKAKADIVSLPDGRTAEVTGRFRADSAEELAAQLSAALNDEKDSHDLAIERHISEIRSRTADLERDRRSLFSSALERPPDDGVSMSRAISVGEAKTRAQRMRDLIIENSKRVIPDSEVSDVGDEEKD